MPVEPGCHGQPGPGSGVAAGFAEAETRPALRADPWMMDGHDEETALAAVQARLTRRFPDLHPDVVEAAVRLAHSTLDGPVRDFVPLLVERAARDRLSFALRDDRPQDLDDDARDDIRDDARHDGLDGLTPAAHPSAELGPSSISR